MLEALARAIHLKRAVLFVGAGASVDLGLPSWTQLTAHMASELGYDADVLIGPGANYLMIAEYYKLEKGSIGPLRSWMDREWDVKKETLSSSRIHNKIIDLDFKYIYTTNYDRNIEKSFEIRGKKFSKIANAKDIVLANLDDTHIVKFHGDFDDDSSIVLTESDYFERLNFETPLDVKFRSDILGRTILFVGYSLTDINMRILLYKMQKMWKNSGYENDRPPSYLFMTRPDPVQERILRSWGVHTITSDVEKVEDALPNLFDELKKAVAALR